MARLQQGFATGEMGFTHHFAEQQSSEPNVRFGSKADILHCGKSAVIQYLVDGREERRRKSVFQNRNAALSHLMLYVYAASSRRLP